MTCTRIANGIVCHQPDFKPGDPAPEGYLAWHEWAEVQHKAGLRQKECCRCGKWWYPQQLSDQVHRYTARTAHGRKVAIESAVCNDCESKEGSTT